MWSDASHLPDYDKNNMSYSSATATVCNYLQLCDLCHTSYKQPVPKVLTWTHAQASWNGNFIFC
jgi:hypothetical protein